MSSARGSTQTLWVKSNFSMSNKFDNEEFRKLVVKEEARQLKEYEFVEEASWFGTTGLDEDTEREVAHYVRREFGESVFDEDGLKASDLEYLGVFETDQGPTHFWKIPASDDNVFAYAEPYDHDTYCLGLGDRTPPNYP